MRKPLLASVAPLLFGLLLLGLLLAGCASDDDASAEAGDEATATPEETSEAEREAVTITLVTHDSFAVSEGIFDSFSTDTGITVEVISGGDAGELVSRAVLSAGDPEGDVLFGIDNTFLQRGLDANIFSPYESDLLSAVDDALKLDDEHRVTPIDFGDVCLNTVAGLGLTSMGDLTDPQYASAFVTQNPESSSPGFAFLLATIATYGDDWEDYWQQLADGGVTVTAGWSDAYYGEFVSGGGDKTIVTSYATSPVAEVVFADPPITEAPTSVVVDSCFRQVEFAGVLAGSDHPAEAGALIDFMLSPEFQADIPLNMFVAPANSEVPLPPEFISHGIKIDTPLTLSPQEIEAGRLDWTDRWVEIVLR